MRFEVSVDKLDAVNLKVSTNLLIKLTFLHCSYFFNSICIKSKYTHNKTGVVVTWIMDKTKYEIW